MVDDEIVDTSIRSSAPAVQESIYTTSMADNPKPGNASSYRPYNSSSVSSGVSLIISLTTSLIIFHPKHIQFYHFSVTHTTSFISYTQGLQIYLFPHICFIHPYTPLYTLLSQIIYLYTGTYSSNTSSMSSGTYGSGAYGSEGTSGDHTIARDKYAGLKGISSDHFFGMSGV